MVPCNQKLCDKSFREREPPTDFSRIGIPQIIRSWLCVLTICYIRFVLYWRSRSSLIKLLSCLIGIRSVGFVWESSNWWGWIWSTAHSICRLSSYETEKRTAPSAIDTQRVCLYENFTFTVPSNWGKGMSGCVVMATLKIRHLSFRLQMARKLWQRKHERSHKYSKTLTLKRWSAQTDRY